MEKHYYAKNSDGSYYVIGLDKSEGERLNLQSVEDVRAAGLVLMSGQLVDISTRPSEFCEFVGGTWTVNMQAVRARRDRLLAESDWTDTLSAKARLGAELYQGWQDYRQALRDVTLQPDPLNIVWPVAP